MLSSVISLSLASIRPFLRISARRPSSSKGSAAA
jgi:hypothetical protein